MVAIRGASYIFQSILVKAKILDYVSFFEEKNSLIKRVFPFKEKSKSRVDKQTMAVKCPSQCVASGTFYFGWSCLYLAP